MENNKSFYEKLILVQKNALNKISKNAEVKYNGTKFYYADLNNILSVVVPLLTENGLFLSSYIEDHSLITKITDGKESITSVYVLPPYPNTTSSKTMQDMGGFITYAKRYNLVALLMLDTDADTDGNSVNNGNNVNNQQKPKQVAQNGKSFTVEEFKHINTHKDLQAYYASLSDADKKKYENIISEKGKLCKTLEGISNINNFNAWYAGLKNDIKAVYQEKFADLIDQHMNRLENSI